jgi:hypothetical protein
MTLTPHPPIYTRAQAREVRQIRKNRASIPASPMSHPRCLADERAYQNHGA